MENGFSLIELFKLGGPFMWVLLAFSVATLGIVIERCIYLYWHNCKAYPISGKIKDFLRDGKRDDALQKQRHRNVFAEWKTASTILRRFLPSRLSPAFWERYQE